MIIEKEQPDLVMNTGDLVSGNKWDKLTQGWARMQYKKFTDVMGKHKQYFCSTAGNHDSEADMTREQLSALDREHEYSLTKPNAQDGLSHAFNYLLPIYDNNGTDVRFRVWCLDTGHKGCLGVKGCSCAKPDQVKWFREENNKITD